MTSTRGALLVLVDAFPAKTVFELELLSWLDGRRPLRPGIGYSITQKAEMLSGLYPDDLGFLNHWQPIENQSVRRRLGQGILDSFRNRLPLADRALHKVLGRIGLGTLNTPWEFSGHFVEAEGGYYDGAASIVGDWQSVIGEDRKGGFDDLDTLTLAEREVEGGASRIFVSLAELDHIGHAFGPESREFINHAQRIDRALSRIADRFLTANPGAFVCVFSDHGMLAVEREVSVTGSVFDLPGGRRALYWLDSTMVRYWTGGMDATRIERKLAALGVQLLSESERTRFGVSSPQFGAGIGLLPAGGVFSPNNFGARAPKGMHGYYPDNADHFGVVAWSGDSAIPTLTLPIGTVDFFTAVKSSCTKTVDSVGAEPA